MPGSADRPSAAKAKKRKQRPEEDGVGGGGGGGGGEASASSSSKKRRRADRRRDEDDSLLDLEAGLNTAFARMDAQLLADHLDRQTARFGTELSPVELADLHVPAGALRDTTAWDRPRTLGHLPAFLEAFAGEDGRLGQAPPMKGAPHTIVVAGAGLRAADLVRAVRKYQTKGNPVSKLFAKHIKLEEAIVFLESTKTGIGVGTPARLADLVENGALKLDHLKRIVVDASHIDQKKRGVMDMKDTMIPLARWLGRKEFKDRYAAEEGRLDLLFY